MKTLALNLLLSALLVLAPVKAALLMTLTLVILDMVTGCLAALKRGESLTSNGFKRTVVKLFVYLSVVILAYLTQQFITGDLMPLEKILAGLIGLTELKSVLENAEEITGIPLLQVLIDKLNQTGK